MVVASGFVAGWAETTNKIASNRSIASHPLVASSESILSLSSGSLILRSSIFLSWNRASLGSRFSKKQVRPKSITRTLRLDAELDDNLLKLAESENISVNLLINKALTRYVEWDAHAEIRPTIDFQETPKGPL